MFRFFPPFILTRSAILVLLWMGVLAASLSTVYSQTVAKEFRLDHCGIRYNGHLLRTGMQLEDWSTVLGATPRGIPAAENNGIFEYVWDDLGIAVNMASDWMDRDTFVGSAYFTFQHSPPVAPHSSEASMAALSRSPPYSSRSISLGFRSTPRRRWRNSMPRL
jgi:hypothetical protein